MTSKHRYFLLFILHMLSLSMSMSASVPDSLTYENYDTQTDFGFFHYLAIIIFFLIIIILLLISAQKVYLSFQYKRWFGKFKPYPPKWSTKIPFNGDLQQCFGYISAIEPSKVWFKHKMKAFFIRMINNGDIELLEDHDRVVRIINPPAAKLPSSVTMSYENVYHCLLSILWANSNEDNIVSLNDIDINPYDKEKDIDNYNKFEDYYTIVTQYPQVKCSIISPKEARAVMGLKRYLQEATIDYQQLTTNDGILSTEYLVYECLFGITTHSDLNFYDAAIGFSDVWSKRLPRKDKTRKVLAKTLIVILTILVILAFIGIVLSIFKDDDNDNNDENRWKNLESLRRNIDSIKNNIP